MSPSLHRKNIKLHKEFIFIEWKIDNEISRACKSSEKSMIWNWFSAAEVRWAESPSHNVLISHLQSPKFAPPIEFVDQATLSPPEGYKDGGLLDSALSGALGNHVFGAQHIQQLQVIQRLQQQRAAMLAARAAAANATSQVTAPVVDPAAVCTECAECAECAAAKLAELEGGKWRDSFAINL